MSDAPMFPAMPSPSMSAEITRLTELLLAERTQRSYERQQFEAELTRLRTIAAAAGTIEYAHSAREDRLYVKSSISRTALMHATNPEEVFADAINHAMEHFRLQLDLQRRLTDPMYRAAEAAAAFNHALADAIKPPRTPR